jgi:elongation factor P
MVIAAELKAGMALLLEGRIYKVLETEFKAGSAKLDGVVKTKLSNVRSGRLWEPHFRPLERLETLEIERRTLEFLFSDRERSTFMDPESFEQFEVPAEVLGPGGAFLESGMMLPVEFYAGEVIGVLVPDVAEARVGSTAPASHAQQDSAWKEAVLENGLVLRVPLFVGPGDTIRVDVRDLRYLGRGRSERKRSA